MNVDGIKTGYTRQAGYNLVSSATQGEMRLIAVVMGAKNLMPVKQKVKSSLAMASASLKLWRQIMRVRCLQQKKSGWQISYDRPRTQ